MGCPIDQKLYGGDLMTFREFLDGKYGVSHAVISLLMIGVGTLVGGVYGNLFMSGAAIGAYYMREAVQHGSYNPRTWNVDGQLDAAFPGLIVLTNIALLLPWAI